MKTALAGIRAWVGLLDLDTHSPHDDVHFFICLQTYTHKHKYKQDIRSAHDHHPEGTLRGLGDGSGRLPWQCRAAEKSRK